MDMTRLSVLSITSSWSALPKLIISTDGTISADEINKNLSFWPGELVVEYWDNIAAYYTKKGKTELVEYGNTHIFGKKLAIILYYAATTPVLWIDSDILFFKDFLPYIPERTNGFACGGSEDFTAAYHEPVLKGFNNNLYKLYKFNAGLLYVSGDSIYEDFNLQQIIKAIHPDYDFCTEQSIFAHIASKSLGILWSKEIVKNFNEDSQELKAMPINNATARHYTSNIRHLFWRDALFNL